MQDDFQAGPLSCERSYAGKVLVMYHSMREVPNMF